MEASEKKNQYGFWRWRFSSALVMLFSVSLLTYFCFTQAVSVFQEHASSLQDFQYALINNFLKSALLVVVLGIFISFFATQEYQVLFSKIIKNISANLSLEPDDVADQTIEGRLNNAQSYFEAIRTQKTNLNELSYVEYSLDTILEKNKIYREQLEEQHDLLNGTFLIQLLNGWNQDESEAYTIGASLGIDLLDHDAQVLVFGIEMSYSDRAFAHVKSKKCYLLLHDFLDQMIAGQFIVYDVETDGLLACLILPAEERSLKSRMSATELFRVAWLVREQVSEKTGLLIRSAIGPVENGISGIASSFAEARKLLDYARMIGEEGKVSQAKGSSLELLDNETMSYWFKNEKQFLNCTRAEDFDDAYAVFSRMLSSDYMRNAPTLDLAKHRMLELINLLSSATEEIARLYDLESVDSLCPREDILSCVSLQALHQCASNVFTQANYYLVAKKSRSAYDRVASVTNYIQENFTSSDLNVSSLALQFNLNPSYLSRTYKNMTGIGLSDFIQSLRIREAKKLMQQTTKSITEIAELSGFSNPLAMNRAFKKNEGTTPSKLRIAINEENE